MSLLFKVRSAEPQLRVWSAHWVDNDKCVLIIPFRGMCVISHMFGACFSKFSVGLHGFDP